MRMRLKHLTRRAVRAPIRFKTTAQCFLVETEAIADSIELFDRHRGFATAAAAFRHGRYGSLRHFRVLFP